MINESWHDTQRSIVILITTVCKIEVRLTFRFNLKVKLSPQIHSLVVKQAEYVLCMLTKTLNGYLCCHCMFARQPVKNVKFELQTCPVQHVLANAAGKIKCVLCTLSLTLNPVTNGATHFGKQEEAAAHGLYV